MEENPLVISKARKSGRMAKTLSISPKSSWTSGNVQIVPLLKHVVRIVVHFELLQARQIVTKQLFSIQLVP